LSSPGPIGSCTSPASRLPPARGSARRTHARGRQDLDISQHARGGGPTCIVQQLEGVLQGDLGPADEEVVQGADLVHQGVVHAVHDAREDAGVLHTAVPPHLPQEQLLLWRDGVQWVAAADPLELLLVAGEGLPPCPPRDLGQALGLGDVGREHHAATIRVRKVDLNRR
jgi:hypothetical protein